MPKAFGKQQLCSIFVIFKVKQSNRTIEQTITPQAYQLGFSVFPPPPPKQANGIRFLLWL